MDAEIRCSLQSPRHAAGRECPATLCLGRSATLYREIIAHEKLDFEFKTEGLLFVWREQKGFDDYAATVALLRDEFGVTAEPITAANCPTWNRR